MSKNGMVHLREKIVNGINYAKEKLGFTLVYEDWGSKQGRCACALGCMLLANDSSLTNDPEDNAVEAAQLLGVSEEWVNSFISGFDNGDPILEDVDAYNLGKQLCHELKPIRSDDFLYAETHGEDNV
jgi:hypothetical protein